MKKNIYLDHHATTPIDPRVFEAMRPFLGEKFGNAASVQHRFGLEAEAAIRRARTQVAQLIGASLEEIVFTSGATEANNLALFGVLSGVQNSKKHLISCSTEHLSVLEPCRVLEKRGCLLTLLSVDRFGQIDPFIFEKSLLNQTQLVSVMFANNEIGTIHPISELSEQTSVRNILFHSDATQALGVVPLDVKALKVDLLSFSAHKIYGPKGIGALWVRQKSPALKLEPLFYGGGHERGLRAGTLNVPAIVGFGEACALAGREFEQNVRHLSHLRNCFWEVLSARLKDRVTCNGHDTERLPHNLNVTIEGVKADRLMMDVREVAFSSGAACVSQKPLEASHVLLAIGKSREEAAASVRFGFGRQNTEEEVLWAAEKIAEAAKRAVSSSD